jgi:hypothetical protein
LRGSKKERKKETWVGLGKKERCLLVFIPRPGSHRRAARTDGPRRLRGQFARSADGPDPRRKLSIITSRTSRDAPPPHEPRGRSVLAWRTVRQEQPDGPA